MDTKKANFTPVAGETGKSKRLSGLAIGLGVAGVAGAGASAAVVLNNVLGKKHYDLDDDDIEEEENPTDENIQEQPAEHHHHHHHHERPEPPAEPDVVNPEPPTPDELEMEPLGWYYEIDNDGNEVFYFLVGDKESGGAMLALAESQPGSGIYDTVIDMTTDPYSVEHIDQFYTREELENVIPNPDREPLPDIDDDINTDDQLDEDNDDDDNNDNSDNGEDGDDVITDDDILDEGEVILDDDEVVLDVDEVILDDDEVILDDDEVVLDDDEVVLDEDEVVIDEDNINVDEEVYGAPVEGIDSEIEDPYIEEDLYPDENIADEPIDDSMMM